MSIPVTQTVAERIAQALARHGVEIVFAQSRPSAVILAAEALGIRQIAYRQENMGGAMADGYVSLPVVRAALMADRPPSPKRRSDCRSSRPARNAALRVRFSDREVVAWHPADMGDGGHGVGVDAGNVAVMDLAAIMTLNARDKERAFEAYARTDRLPNSRMLTLVRPNDTAIADSGWGDGRYPAYWGVDADNSPVVLIVDFRLLPQT